MDRTKHYYHEAFYEGKWMVCADWNSRGYDWRAENLATRSGCKVRIRQCGKTLATVMPDQEIREINGLDGVEDPRTVLLNHF